MSVSPWKTAETAPGKWQVYGGGKLYGPFPTKPMAMYWVDLFNDLHANRQEMPREPREGWFGKEVTR